MLFELRQYKIEPGHRAAFVELMERKIIPFQVQQGMVILGSFVNEEDDDSYIWIRRFRSEEEREQLYDAVYNSDYWRDEIAPSVGAMMNREGIVVTRLNATPRSPIQ